MTPSQLVLQTGETFSGVSPIHQKSVAFGEVVFNTGMVGYEQTLTDPSYCGQIITFTYPLMGNYGVGPESTWESKAIHAHGMVVSTLEEAHARDVKGESLSEFCKRFNVPLIAEVDTRAVTKVLRDYGVVSGAIVTNGKKPPAFPDVNSTHLVKRVSIEKPIEHGTGKKRVVVIDCGMKENIWRNLCAFKNVSLKRVPFDYDFTTEKFDGVFISNGPGDPSMCVETIAIMKQVLKMKKPTFGICLGSQIMALAVGAKTYKLRFGHRSQNQPCLREGTDRVFLTSQNHGFSIIEETLPKEWDVTYRNLNDASVQGIAHKKHPFFSVQFHPEACPGPTDTAFLFDEFYKML
jgi:carbamoyl-phosphate synthase small subunit